MLSGHDLQRDGHTANLPPLLCQAMLTRRCCNGHSCRTLPGHVLLPLGKPVTDHAHMLTEIVVSLVSRGWCPLITTKLLNNNVHFFSPPHACAIGPCPVLSRRRQSELMQQQPTCATGVHGLAAIDLSSCSSILSRC